MHQFVKQHFFHILLLGIGTVQQNNGFLVITINLEITGFAPRRIFYPLDQVTEALITCNFEEGTPGYNFAYYGFFTTLEQTVEELAKCFLLEFGENKELSFGRCKKMKSFTELYDGLNNIE